MAIYRLGTNAVRDGVQIALGLGAAALVALSPIGLVPVLLAAGSLGIWLYHSRRLGLVLLAGVVLVETGAILGGHAGLAPRLPAWLASGSEARRPACWRSAS